MFDGGITMFSHKLNYGPILLGNACKGRRCWYRLRSNLPVAAEFSLLPLQTNDGKISPQSMKISGSGTVSSGYHRPDYLLNQANTVGIIGGVSVCSTLIFLEKLAHWSLRDGNECLPFVVCSDPALTRLNSPHGTSYSFGGKNVQVDMDVGEVIQNLQGKRKFLEQSGACCIVMPCHISHAWYDKISEDCLLPFFHVGECVANELKDAKLKPLEAGSEVRIGLLAANAILTAGFYQDTLQSQGFEVVLPDKATMDHILVPAIEALNRRDLKGAQNLLRIAIQVLLMRAVNIVILASDEIQSLLPHHDPLLKKCIDPMDALARSTIKWARCTVKVHENTSNVI